MNNKIKELEEAALNVEYYELQFPDGEIEISLDNSTVTINEYSASQQAAFPRKVIGSIRDFFSTKEIRQLCDKHSWYIVG